MSGGIKKLIVTVIEGKGLKETNLLTKMTTYVHFKCGGEEFKTKPAEKQDKNPKFNNQEFIFNLDGKEDVVHIVIYSKETLSDERIGRMDVKIADMAKAEKPTWFNVFDMDNFSKERGMLCLRVECEPKHHHKKEEQKAATTTTVQQPQQVKQQIQVQQQPQVVMQQPPQMMMQQQPQVEIIYQPMPQQMMMGQQMPMMQMPMMGQQMPMMMGMGQPMMGQPMMQPQIVFGQPQQYGQPVIVETIYPNQQPQQR